jgi:hypothetical protein
MASHCGALWTSIASHLGSSIYLLDTILSQPNMGREEHSAPPAKLTAVPTTSQHRSKPIKAAEKGHYHKSFSQGDYSLEVQRYHCPTVHPSNNTKDRVRY